MDFYESPMSTNDLNAPATGCPPSAHSGSNPNQGNQGKGNQQQHHHQQRGATTNKTASLSNSNLIDSASLNINLPASDLNSPELSFDLQQYINNEIAAAAASVVVGGNSAQANGISLDDSLFRELLGENTKKTLIQQQQQQNQQQSDQQQQQHQQEVQQRHLEDIEDEDEEEDEPEIIGNLEHNTNQLNQVINSFSSYQLTEQQVNGSRLTLSSSKRFNQEGLSVKQEPSDDQATDFSSNCSQNSGVYGVGQFTGFNERSNGGGNGPNLSVGGHRGSFNAGSTSSGNGTNSSSEVPGGPLSLVHFGGSGAGSPALSLMSGRSSVHGHHGHHKSSKHSKKNVDKASDEYKKRRERNNIAVRKSREKAKIRSRETEKRVNVLQTDNEGLRKRVDLLTKELTVLKSLLNNVGVPPEDVEREIQQGLQSMNDHQQQQQQQHHHQQQQQQHHHNNPYM